ncbi:MAG TPA: hypothetical protein VH682_04460 [Gemmataceae bacterium]|jgi:hypothetical protein
MNALLRTVVVVLVVGLLTLGVFGLRLACFPGEFPESQDNEKFQRLKQATERRMEARQQAVQEYIAGRCTLAETMRRFQELDHEWPDFVTSNRKWWPSDEERHYRVLLSGVEGILQGQPEELAATLRRLEEDRQQLQAGRRTPSTAEIGSDEK